MKKTSIIILIISFFTLLAPLTSSAALCLGFAPGTASCLESQEKQTSYLESQEKQKTYRERSGNLSSYSQFFEEVGVNLDIETSESQYKRWLNELMEAQEDHEEELQEEQDRKEELIKQQEYEEISKDKELNERILELENKVKDLESKKNKPIVVPKQIYIQPVIEKSSYPVKVIKPKTETIKIETDDIQLIEEEISIKETVPVIQTITEPIPKKASWFKKIINWFSGK